MSILSLSVCTVKNYSKIIKYICFPLVVHLDLAKGETLHLFTLPVTFSQCYNDFPKPANSF